MRDLVVLGGSSHPELTQAVCYRLGIPPGHTTLGKFSNHETSVEIKESVRERDVYIIQSGCGNVNDNFIELLIMINGAKIASARRITAVIPHFPYSRQPDAPYKSAGAPLTSLPPSTPKQAKSPISVEDVGKQLMRKLATTSLQQKQQQQQQDDDPSASLGADASCSKKNPDYKPWIARSGTLIADLLTCSGVDHIITMDLHDAQFQGFFDCPVDNLMSRALMIKYIHLHIPNYQQAVIVSPDAGGAKRATAIAEKLCMDFALVHKERRQKLTQRTDLMLVGDVRGKECVLVDDIADTSYTITKAARMLRDHGALKIYAIVSHALLSANALDNIEQSAIDQLIVSNSIPQAHHLSSPKIKVFDVAPLFAEAIRRSHFGESMSLLLNPQYDLD